MPLPEFIDNALLHLYCTVSSTQGHTPREKRNQILCKHLKPLLKDNRYQSLKSEIKQMLHIGRNKNGHLEEKLWVLHTMSQDYYANLNGAQSLFDLLNTLYDQYGLESRLHNEEETQEDDVIYMLSDHITHCFDDEQNQIAPLSMLLQGKNADKLAGYVNRTGLFRAEITEFNEEKRQGHIILHPAKRA